MTKREKVLHIFLHHKFNSIKDIIKKTGYKRYFINKVINSYINKKMKAK